MAPALVLWACSSGLAPLAAFALSYGVFYAGFVALLPALVMGEFGGRSVSGIIGVLYTSVAVGTLVGPSAAGFAFDASHGYVLPILASAGADVVAVALLAATSRAPAPRRRS
jgi:MFS transporter, OFA family, oxalate/formate antiporter